MDGRAIAMLANFINILGLTLSVIFSIGAVIGAAMTMYAAVASRTGEIGTMIEAIQTSAHAAVDRMAEAVRQADGGSQLAGEAGSSIEAIRRASVAGLAGARISAPLASQ